MPGRGRKNSPISRMVGKALCGTEMVRGIFPADTGFVGKEKAMEQQYVRTGEKHKWCRGGLTCI